MLHYKFAIRAVLPILFVWTEAADATTVAKMPFDQLVKQAGSIVDCTVVSQESRRGDDDVIRTYITLKIHEWIIGTDNAETLTIRLLGGTVGGESVNVDDMPDLSVGKRYILFLRQGHKGICPIFGWRQGCFHVGNDADLTESRVTTNEDRLIRGIASGRLIISDTKPEQKSMSLTQFKTIIQRIRNQQLPKAQSP